MRVTKEMIVDAQTKELRAIKEEMDRTGDSLADVMDRRPPYIGWIDENCKARESPRLTVDGGLSDHKALKA